MAISALILAILVAAGVVFDKLTYEEEKRNTYNRLKGWLEKIRQARFPDIHKIAIESCHHFLYRSFNFRKKPLRAFLSLIFVSWLLTTVFYFIGESHPSMQKSRIIQHWHDYFPWYPMYLVNLLFDFLTVFVSLRILTWIKSKPFLIACGGLILDITIAYILFIICIIALIPSIQLALKLNFATNFVIHHNEIDNHRLYGEPMAFKLDNFKLNGYPEYTYSMIKDDHFTEKAQVRYIRHDRSYINARLEAIKQLFSLKAFYSLVVEREPYALNERGELLVTEGNISKTYSLTQISYTFSPTEIALSATTLIPTAIFIFFLLFVYLSKEVFTLSAAFLRRLIKSSLVKEDALDKFSPGTHFGAVLGLLIAILKLLDELI
ncbi:MAG: hypothetical protein KDC65_00425 [Saprospiraceae bacterium]|nr:hypothetical protein [Saprospiraceae bacterium]